ncbi:GGDEF domain-containing protein [Streptomyces sp. NPDC007107]|uniref:GGDEF domain-containing protein n=1 Tax=Streptomyces sp. NPDC007107 TaxID=3156915 RepID=UPI0033CCDCFA
MPAIALPMKTLHITAMAVPLAGWTLHTTVLRRRLVRAQHDLVRAQHDLVRAQHDPLTGTWRREAFTARARRIIERHPDQTLLVLADADHFKRLNDHHGHAAGDTALAAIGRRLTEWAGPTGVAGRLGGDEFAALARIEPRHQELRLDHLARLMARPVPYADGTLPLAVSVGAATPAAIGSGDLPALMRAADTAMYEGKHTGLVVQAGPVHADTPSVNGRRSGRPGTAVRGRPA